MSNPQQRYFVRVIKIRAECSPNVRLAQAQLAAGMPPTNDIIVPGVLPYSEYVKRRTLWDPILQCIGLDAQFWEGEDVLLFPPHWLNKAEQRADQLRINRTPRKAVAMGLDPGEGVADTVWAIVDELGLIYMMGLKTPDPSIIIRETIALIRRYDVPPENVLIDAGGGLTIAGILRNEHDLPVRTVGFGESPTDSKRKRTRWSDRISDQENKTAYTNRRAQMYGELAEWLDPYLNEQLFAIPAEYTELRFEMAPIPKLRDREGKLKMLPKNKRDPRCQEKTLSELIGRSPDHADSLCLAVHSMTHRFRPIEISAF